MQQDRDNIQQQLYLKESVMKQYQQAFEDLKCKNYQMENVAFTYHMTVQRLKDKELELMQKLEEV
jgi:2'-5' RNA ligase